MLNKIHNADCLTFLKSMPDESIDCIVTSPPYWGLRDYGVEEQLGLESTFELFVSHLIEVFAECKRVLKKTGTCWINIGDTYATHTGKRSAQFGGDITSDSNNVFTNNRERQSVPEKSLCQIPERFSIAMAELGWIKRNTIIWYKRNCMPSSASDRFTVDFEYLYFFVKNQKYWFDQQLEDSIWASRDKRSLHGKVLGKFGKITKGKYGMDGVAYTEGGMKNKRCVWDIPTESNPEAHFAVYPRALISPCIQAGCPPDGIVLDPFAGSGTTCLEAKEQGKNYIGIELNLEYIEISNRRLSQEVLQFGQQGKKEIKSSHIKNTRIVGNLHRASIKVCSGPGGLTTPQAFYKKGKT